MLVFVYQSTLFCKKCGEKMIKDHPQRAKYCKLQEDEYDSDEFPKGPIEEGESDSPSHCEGCGMFLETELTSEGYEYVKEANNLEWNSYYGVNQQKEEVDE